MLQNTNIHSLLLFMGFVVEHTITVNVDNVGAILLLEGTSAS